VSLGLAVAARRRRTAALSGAEPLPGAMMITQKRIFITLRNAWAAQADT
jgi:hypothetical protein